MKIAAALAWFDEPVEHLERLVRSLAPHVDLLIALDGRWEPFPHERNVSPMPQRVALGQVCAEVGLDHTSYVDVLECPYPTQADKRDHLFRFVAEWDTDWILIVDGDLEVTRFDPDVRGRLADCSADVAALRVETLHPGAFIRPRQQRLLFRSAAAPHMGAVHNEYLAGDGRVLKAHDHQESEVALELGETITLTHHLFSRGQERNRRSAQHYVRRSRAGEGDRQRQAVA